LTIYDLEVNSTWTGKDSNGEDVKGTLKVPEVSHEAIDGLSDYVVGSSSLCPG
jgi:activator of HSP90 ATPase